MRKEDYLPWFEKLVKKSEQIKILQGEYMHERYFDEEDSREWATEAESALSTVFPEHHACRRAWHRVFEDQHSIHVQHVVEKLRGTFRAAYNQLRDGRLGSLIESIRVETESDLLEQAQILADANHSAAAAVIAGGALETHLRHLVAKHGLTLNGHGSISAYNLVIAQARKTGTEVYSKADHDQVESWGKTRNEAAHNPGNFKATRDQIKLMIEGVRQFIARTATA
jgi:hypothetical protein